jgi:hypothetical protein
MAFLKKELVILFLLSVLFSAGINAKELKLYEQEIKAGLLYNFLKYTNWPVSDKNDAKIVLCVFGEDPFSGYLLPMEGRSVNQSLIKIRSIHTAEDAADCQMIFLNSAEKKQWPQLKGFIANKSILTVSDLSGFTNAGGMIEFGRKDDHISVLLNKNALTDAKLSVQDRLLKLVTVVADDSEGVR